MAIYVVIEMEDESDFENLKDCLLDNNAELAGVFKKPTVFHDDHPQKRRADGYTRGRKFGWWVCAICKKPTKQWASNINAVLSAAYNLLRPCGHLQGDEFCEECA